jgi:hypothetical protein
MKTYSKIYRAVYELWTFFRTKTLLLEGLFFRYEETLNNLQYHHYEKCFPIAHK